MDENESLRRAVHETLTVAPYDATWPSRFEAERARLEMFWNGWGRVEHFGSTAVPGMPAKPVIDILAAVPSMEIADRLVINLCNNGYTTSAEFNSTLHDRRWLMRHSQGCRTHHLHLVLPNSVDWVSRLKFRDLLRSRPTLAAEYADLKRSLADSLGSDREAYGAAKTDFISRALSQHGDDAEIS